MTNTVNWDNVEEKLLNDKRQHYFSSTDDIQVAFDCIIEMYKDDNPEWLTMVNYTYKKLRYFESNGLPMLNFRSTFDYCLKSLRVVLDVADLHKIKNIITLKEARAIQEMQKPTAWKVRVDYAKIRDKMNYYGIQRTELPALLGVSIRDPLRTMAGNYRGEMVGVDINALAKFALLLHCSIDDLLLKEYQG